MKKKNWRLIICVLLIVLSAVCYALQIRIFKTPRDTFFYMLQDIAFVPIQVLIVTLIIDELLSIRERRALLQKMNMVIGAFFSETGSPLLRRFICFDPGADQLGRDLVFTQKWTPQDYAQLAKNISVRSFTLDLSRGSLEDLKAFLTENRKFLLILLENPNLLEHESFTNLLWAVFHLTEELCARADLRRLSDTDIDHITNDVKRAYTLLLKEWIFYVRHLQAGYPFIFSFITRTNPFDPAACIEVR
jgi:hypothetical protein